MTRLLVLAVVLASACRSAPPAPDHSPLFDSLDAGFAPLEETREWLSGDQAVFRIDVEDSSSESTVFVRFEVLPLPGVADSAFRVTETRNYELTYDTPDGERVVEQLTSPITYFGVEVYDADGRLEESQISKVPEAFLTHGFARACEVARDYDEADASNGPALDRDAIREYFQGFFSLVSLLQIVQDNAALAPILWRVLDKPSFLSVLFQGGNVRLGIQGFDEPAEETTHTFPEPLGELPGYTLPLVLTLNDKPALNVQLGVCESLPPLLITGGIVSIDAVHATKPERRVRLSMVASGRGFAQPALESGAGLSE